jgi:hypothetical protein
VDLRRGAGPVPEKKIGAILFEKNKLKFPGPFFFSLDMDWPESIITPNFYQLAFFRKRGIFSFQL